jgi:monofunctional biosynthetic peptidoglycan transglycosylase
MIVSRKKTNRFLYILIKWVVILHLIFLATGAVVVFIYKYTNPRVTSLSLYRQYVQGVKNQPFEFIPLKELDPSIKKVLIKLEDPQFKRHYGIDLDAMMAAYKINKKYNKTLAGGSTITQQLVRTLFLLPNKNYLRKYLEVLLALEMELILNKNRILELYFNNVEFGKGVYGIGPAAKHYFKTSVYNLSTEQLTQLLIILPSPIKYSPKDIQRKSFFRKRYRILARDPVLNKYVDEPEIEGAEHLSEFPK